MLGLEIITGRLDGAGIVYCLVGGLAAIAYGRPRLTLDADLIVSLEPGQEDVLLQAFPPEDFYLPPKEVLRMEAARDRRGHFNIIHQHSALRADCYLPGQSEFAHWELRNRRRLATSFGAAWFSPPEGVIANKLLFYREGRSPKHLDDIRSILQAGSVPDRSLLASWISRLGLDPEWAEVGV